MRIVKYRGSAHGTDEYPFVIDADGFSVFPLTSLALAHEASSERVASGVQRLDEMLGGGYFRGATVLASGEPGSGKTSLAAALVRAACERGERCLYLAMEESPSQLVRNMRSIGIDLEPFVRDGTLAFVGAEGVGVRARGPLDRDSQGGCRLRARDRRDRSAERVRRRGARGQVDARAADRLPQGARHHRVSDGADDAQDSEAGGISSLVDTWLLLSNHELAGERNRAIMVLKSRGTAHSNQLREFVLSNDGIEIVDAYAGEGAC